jgi:hypothetical protein
MSKKNRKPRDPLRRAEQPKVGRPSPVALLPVPKQILHALQHTRRPSVELIEAVRDGRPTYLDSVFARQVWSETVFVPSLVMVCQQLHALGAQDHKELMLTLLAETTRDFANTAWRVLPASFSGWREPRPTRRLGATLLSGACSRPLRSRRMKTTCASESFASRATCWVDGARRGTHRLKSREGCPTRSTFQLDGNVQSLACLRSKAARPQCSEDDARECSF